MVVSKVAKSFVDEFVVGFGFFSGLWICIGVNPETEFIKAFTDVVNQLAPQWGFIFWLIPVVVTLGSVVGAYFMGGWFGLGAVGLAFLGGCFITNPVGIWLLIIGMLIGFFAPMMRNGHSQ